MFDHLDDDFPPVPDGLARVHVERRAQGRRRRRVALASAGGAAVVAGLLGAAVVATATGPSTDGSATQVFLGTDPQAPSPTPDVSADGIPGWSNGATSCRVITDIPSGPVSQEVVDGLSAAIVIPQSVRAGQEFTATIRLSNASSQALTVTVTDASSGSAIVKNAAHEFSPAAARRPPTQTVTVPAGGTADLEPRTAQTVACGDTESDAKVALPAQDQVGVGVDLGVESVKAPSGAELLYDRDQLQLMDFIDLT